MTIEKKNCKNSRWLFQKNNFCLLHFSSLLVFLKYYVKFTGME